MTQPVEGLGHADQMDKPGQERDFFSARQQEEHPAVPTGIGVLKGFGHPRPGSEALAEAGAYLADGDSMEGGIGLTVTPAVEPMPLRLA